MCPLHADGERTGVRPLPDLSAGDGVAFTATTDDKNKPLDGRCDVVVSGVTPVTSVRLSAGTHHLACETLGGATLTTRVAIGASTTQRVTLAPPTQAAAAPEPGFF